MNLFQKLVDEYTQKKKTMSQALEKLLQFLLNSYEVGDNVLKLSKAIDQSNPNRRILTQLEEQLLKIKTLQDQQPGSIGLQIYLERLNNIVQEKYFIVENLIVQATQNPQRGRQMPGTNYQQSLDDLQARSQSRDELKKAIYTR